MHLDASSQLKRRERKPRRSPSANSRVLRNGLQQSESIGTKVKRQRSFTKKTKCDHNDTYLLRGLDSQGPNLLKALQTFWFETIMQQEQQQQQQKEQSQVEIVNCNSRSAEIGSSEQKCGFYPREPSESAPIRALKSTLRRFFGNTNETPRPLAASGQRTGYGTNEPAKKPSDSSQHNTAHITSSWASGVGRKRIRDFARAKYESVAARSGVSSTCKRRKSKWLARETWFLGPLLLIGVFSIAIHSLQAAPILEFQPEDVGLVLDTPTSMIESGGPQLILGRLATDEEPLEDSSEDESGENDAELSKTAQQVQMTNIEWPVAGPEVEPGMETGGEFEVERRRLNRDRALEPAPWLRQQPMRRNSNAPLVDRLERRSLQLGDEGYEPLLNLLLEEAHTGFLSRGGSASQRASTPISGRLAALALVAPPNARHETIEQLVWANLSSLGPNLASLRDENPAPVVAAFGEVEFPIEHEDENLLSYSDTEPSTGLNIQGMLGLKETQPTFHVLEDLDRDNLERDDLDQVSPIERDSSLISLPRSSEGARRRSKRKTSPSSDLELLIEGYERRPQEQPGLKQFRPLAKTQVAGPKLHQILFNIATNFRRQLEVALRIPEGSIVGLYPLNEQQLLVKLDESRLSKPERLRLIEKYDSWQNFILLSWPKSASKQSPVPKLMSLAHLLQAVSENEPSWKPAERPRMDQLRAKVLLSNLNKLRWMPEGDIEEVEESEVEQSGPEMGFDSKAEALAIYLQSLGLGSQLLLPSGQANGYVALISANRRLNVDEPAQERKWTWPVGQEATTHLFGALLAFLGALIAVKLLLSKRRVIGEKVSESKTDEGETKLGHVSQQLGAYWSSASSTCSQILEQRKRRKLASDEELGQLEPEEREAKISSRIIPSKLGSLFGRQKTKVIEEADELDLQAPEQVQKEGKFRSSRSYIRSLIEILSKGRGTGGSAPEASQMEADEDSTCIVQPDPETQDSTASSCGGESRGLQSQMDISAAHLILAYMEKHLEDREHLRREWLELNAAPAKSSSAHQAANSARINRLILDKHAKVGSMKENQVKNRTNQVLPFDRNRVKLRLTNLWHPASADSSGNSLQSTGSVSPQSDYINASYIHDDDPRRPTHILAQGPTEQTVPQFWQMIWEQGISVIVMLTRLSENNKPLCHCYWPSDSNRQSDSVNQDDVTGNGRRQSVTSVYANPNGRQGIQAAVVANSGSASKVLYFEIVERHSAGSSALKSASQSEQSSRVSRFEVHLVSEHVSSSDYLVRNMYIINRSSGETRTISQFHYLAWPDSGVPENVKGFLSFRRKVHKSFRAPKSPILVHCSDGAARSGAYVLIDMILERIKMGAKEIDLRATLEHLRDQRVGCCATQKQFEFALVALAQEIQIIVDALPH